MSENIKKVSLVYLILLPALILITPGFVFSQNDYQAKRSKAIDLFNQNKFIEARPLFEELAKAKPDDAEVLYDTGFLVFTYAQTLKDAEPRRQNGLKAREYLVKAQQLGVDNNILRNMLGSIGADGSIDQLKYSNDLEADKALKEGEQYFAAGDFKNAITAYQKALKLAPTLYEAALYTGDVYYKASDFEKASEWFAKAIQIDPTRETAHRYWADSLTKEGKTKEAQDKYIDAFVAEPYSNYARSAFINWAKENSLNLAHPAIKFPASVSTGNGNTNITLDPSILSGDKEDGSNAWLVYGLQRSLWTSGKDGKISEKFAKAYPGEVSYRHSLAEEMDALQMVLKTLSEDKKIKTLDPSLANLKKLNDAGLLESYMLIAHLDAGLFRDYKPYLLVNRDKLRRYVVEYVMTGGGNL